MATTVETETERYRIEWDDDIDAVIYTWTEFASGEQFRDGANALLEYVSENDVTNVIVDSSGIQAHDDDDQAWLAREWTPAMIDAGMEYNVVVHKESIISEMDVEALMESLEELPYESTVTVSMAEARDWIANR
ncbi:hypothetical protein AB7C87_14885 [Natrarchaeobius sp. A-rgal3]|uniref:hypothetical protein n=1 Tax=Natrarchaeobius versutus TaxID=1679078 RepID=UPI00350EF589